LARRQQLWRGLLGKADVSGVQAAAIAVGAVLGILDQSRHGPTGDNAQQCTERTNGTAPEPRQTKIDGKAKNEEDPRPNCLPEVGCLKLRNTAPSTK
jgi:hypothetical protein